MQRKDVAESGHSSVDPAGPLVAVAARAAALHPDRVPRHSVDVAHVRVHGLGGDVGRVGAAGGQVIERAEHVAHLGLDHVDGRIVAGAAFGPSSAYMFGKPCAVVEACAAIPLLHSSPSGPGAAAAEVAGDGEGRVE